jgi:hypothetical protein
MTRLCSCCASPGVRVPLVRSRLALVILASALMGGCGKPNIPSYSVVESGGKLTVTLHTTGGDIPVEIEKRTSGSGTREGTRSSGGVSLSYEIKYQHNGDQTTLSSVKLDGQDIPKAD